MGSSFPILKFQKWKTFSGEDFKVNLLCKHPHAQSGGFAVHLRMRLESEVLNKQLRGSFVQHLRLDHTLNLSQQGLNVGESKYCTGYVNT